MALSATERTSIINLVVGMFNAAPGSTYLAELTVAYEASGRSLSHLAKLLSDTTGYKALNPVYQTAAEFATSFLTPLGLQANTEAIDYITAKFNAGESKGQIAHDAMAAIKASVAPAFANAQAILTNKTSAAEYYSVTLGTAQTSIAALQAAISTVTADPASVTSTNATNAGASSAGQTFTLTKGINEFTGASGNDTFDGTEDSTAAATFSNLDKLDGGAGTDTLKIVQAAAVNTTTVVGATVSNIEKINITSGASVTTNTSTWTGATALTIAAGTDVTATAAATTDITAAASALSSAGGAVTVNGGMNVTITAADTSTTAVASANTILVGGTTAAAGAVKVTYTETISDAANGGVAGSAVTVTGGTTVEVNSLAVAGAGSNLADVLTLGQVDVNGNASTTSVTVKQSAATATYNGTTQKNISIVNGAVNVVDANATTVSDTITTVTLENFGASEIKSTVLSTLNLTAGATIAGGAVTLTQTAADKSTAATTLALNTSGSFGKISGTQADVYKTVNVTAAAATTIADIEMDALTTLNVAGTGVATFTALTAAQNAKLATVASTGGGVTIGTELATGVAVTGGAGVESILIGATTKTIDLGAGNDVVTVSTTTMGAGGAVKGGEGTDTLVANTNSSAFAGLPAFTGFETLRVAGAAAQGAHNAVGFTALELGATAAAVSSLINVAAGVGLTVLAAPGGAHTVTLADATGKADSFNMTFKSAADLDLSTNGITLAGVETINITNTDSNTTAHTNKLKLTADSVTSIVVTGNAGLDLTGSTYAKVTSFDASGITGAAADAATLAVTYVSGNATIAENVSIKGGAGNDSLTGNAANNDTILGGDGTDTLVYAGGMDSFTGGAGKDTFDINGVGTSAIYLAVTDAAVGDKLDFVGISTGTIANATLGAKVTLGGAATLTQYLDAAAAGDGGTNALVKWFQFGTDTYVVVDNAAGATFVSATDAVVKLTGVIDLSTSALATEVLTLA
jgi:S-layer protein